MRIDSMEALTAYLQAVQSRRETSITCELTHALTAQMNDDSLVEALVTHLPMVQGLKPRIVRSRGRGAVLAAKLRYRDGVRMLENGSMLTEAEYAALEIAGTVAEAACQLNGEDAKFRYLYDWVCNHIRYVHTAPGRKGYDQLVGAAAVLKERTANCQGYADVLYLLCGLCQIRCEYRCGRGERKLHLWNVVCLNGEWHEADASKGARALQD